MPFRRRRKSSETGAVVALRDKALSISASELGLEPTADRPDVWGVLMETGYPQAAASLVALADGATSLYFSNGGGVIGAGEHAAVRTASGALLDSAQAHISEFAPVRDTPLPSVGRVAFYIRTFDGLLGAEADEQDLGHGRHPLSPVFHAGHGVIAAVREVSDLDKS